MRSAWKYIDGRRRESTENAEVFNIRRKQAVPASGTKFELAETYSYEEFAASRVVPRRALRHLTALLACQASSRGRPRGENE